MIGITIERVAKKEVKQHVGQCDFGPIVGTLFIEGRPPEVLQKCSQCELIPKYGLTWQQFEKYLQGREIKHRLEIE